MLAVPVLGIVPVQEPERRQAIKNLILNIDQFEKIIFVSQNAARETLRWLDEFWPQLPADIEYFAVGRKTGQVLSENGISASSCLDAMDSDDLLSLPALERVAGQKILICRGCGGRPRLGEQLTARGAAVTYGEFYQRTLPDTAISALRNSDFGRGDYREIISVFSGESLSNLIQVLTLAEIHQWRELPLLVPGQRVAQQARECGFAQIITAVNATDAAMLDALRHWLQRWL